MLSDSDRRTAYSATAPEQQKTRRESETPAFRKGVLLPALLACGLALGFEDSSHAGMPNSAITLSA